MQQFLNDELQDFLNYYESGNKENQNNAQKQNEW